MCSTYGGTCRKHTVPAANIRITKACAVARWTAKKERPKHQTAKQRRMHARGTRVGGGRGRGGEVVPGGSQTNWFGFANTHAIPTRHPSRHVHQNAFRHHDSDDIL